jgi:hypothetical protein
MPHRYLTVADIREGLARISLSADAVLDDRFVGNPGDLPVVFGKAAGFPASPGEPA